MAITSLSELPELGALLGVDPGSKTLGLAVSDPARSIASALVTLKRGKTSDDLDRILALYDERACVGVVLGLPLNMDGAEGPRAQSARAFARNLLAKRDIPIVLQDERLSTAGAERALLEADMSRKRRAEVIDAVAAAFILQGALDRLRYAR